MPSLKGSLLFQGSLLKFQAGQFMFEVDFFEGLRVPAIFDVQEPQGQFRALLFKPGYLMNAGIVFPNS